MTPPKAPGGMTPPKAPGGMTPPKAPGASYKRPQNFALKDLFMVFALLDG
jgi:hypothetical protein